MAQSARSSPTRATRAGRSGTSSPSPKCSSTSTTSGSATPPSRPGTSPASGSGPSRQPTPPIIDTRRLRACPGARSPAASAADERKPHRSRRAVPAARLRLVRHLRPQDARQLEQRQAALPVHVPQPVRREEQGQPSNVRVPARGTAARRRSTSGWPASSTRSLSWAIIRWPIPRQFAEPEPHPHDEDETRAGDRRQRRQAAPAPRRTRNGADLRSSSRAGSKRARSRTKPRYARQKPELKKPTAARRQLTKEEITDLVANVDGIMQALKEADRAGKADLYSRPQVTLKYHYPNEKRVAAESS